MKTNKLYLKKIIYSALFAGSIFFIIYLTYHAQSNYRDIIVRQSQRQLLMTAKSVANGIEEFFRMQKNVLKSLATDPVLLEINSDTDYSQLEMRYKELEGEIGGFYIISPEGIVTHRFPHKKRVGKDFSNKPGVSYVLKTHKPYVSELFYSDSGRACLTVLEPIFFDGKFLGILRALTYVEEIQKKFLRSLYIDNEGYTWVVDDQNRMIMHPNRDYIGKAVIAVREEQFPSYDWAELKHILNDMTKGEEGSGIYHSKWRAGNKTRSGKKLAVYAPVHIGNQSWSIAVSADYSEILKPINEQARTILSIAAFILLLFGIVGFIIYGKQKKEAVLEAEAENLRKISETAAALKKSEEKLARSKKMESLGLLAGGVAHDLNNVLAGITGYPELLLLDLAKDSELREPIEAIKESGLRAAAIVADLLTVARGIASTKEPLSLNEQITCYLDSPEFKKLKHFHPEVKIVSNLDSGIFNITGSPVHLRKVIMNLVSNASEAIQGNGHVTISTDNRHVDTPQNGYDDISAGDYVILSVSDDGFGISPNDLERMFEPFYTKKVMGRSGTGLGLAVVWNVVKDHNGHIDVISNEQGTTFELYFPSTRDELPDEESALSFEVYIGKGESILVVDDVKTQREITCKMLDKLGYKTRAVSSGENAVQYLRDRSVDLIVLDMIMDPGINGKETYKKILNFHPNQKSIIVSGFSETDDVVATQRLGAGKYIKKPFTMKEIGLAVKEEFEKNSIEYNAT